MLFQSWTTQNLAVARFVFAKTEAAADTAEAIHAQIPVLGVQPGAEVAAETVGGKRTAVVAGTETETVAAARIRNAARIIAEVRIVVTAKIVAMATIIAMAKIVAAARIIAAAKIVATARTVAIAETRGRIEVTVKIASTAQNATMATSIIATATKDSRAKTEAKAWIRIIVLVGNAAKRETKTKEMKTTMHGTTTAVEAKKQAGQGAAVHDPLTV